MNILVTRPPADAAPLADALRAGGHTVLVEPLLAIIEEPGAAAALAGALPGAQAVLFTSANGVRAFAAASPRRELRAFTVGDATAQAAHAAGFFPVESAGGDVADLAALVIARLKPADGALVHGAASVVAGDLAATLGAAGFTVRRAVLYRAEPPTALSPAAVKALEAGEIDAALFFSPRTASTFVTLIEAAGLASNCRKITAVALSPAVGSALGALPWRQVRVAAEPTQAALMAAFEGLGESAGGGAASGEHDHQPQDHQLMSDLRAETAGPAREPPGGGTGARYRRRAPWLILAALVILGIVGAAIYGAPALMALRSPAPSDNAAEAARLASFETRLASLEQRLAALDRSVQRLDGMEQHLAQLQQRLDSLANGPVPDTTQQARALGEVTDRLSGLERRLESLSAAESAASNAATRTTSDLGAQTSGLAAAVAEQKAALAKLEAAQAAAPDRGDAAILVAVERLRGALATSRPYEGELRAAEALASGHPDSLAELQKLDARAARGIPSLAALSDRFERAAARIADAAPAPADSSWSERLLGGVKRFFSIRRVGSRATAEPGDVDGIVASAETKLKGGDLAGAVAELKRLTGPPAEAAKPWLDDAEARLGAEQALDALDEALTARLLAEKATGPKP